MEDDSAGMPLPSLGLGLGGGGVEGREGDEEHDASGGLQESAERGYLGVGPEEQLPGADEAQGEQSESQAGAEHGTAGQEGRGGRGEWRSGGRSIGNC